jgi:endonuclease-3
MAKKETKNKKKKILKVDKAEAAERVRKIYPILTNLYPNAQTALRYGNPLELLIATILSAQCTDARVNMVTPGLFKKYPSAKDWADAELSEIENDIRSTGFYRNKALSIKGSCEAIVKEHGGVVPDNMEALVKLPGVGRKTANCVLGNAFGQPAIMCDTHVIRLSRRLQLSENTHDAVKLEFDLAEIVPKKNWTVFCHVLILHGRNICKAPKPDCQACAISKYCPSAFEPSLW